MDAVSPGNGSRVRLQPMCDELKKRRLAVSVPAHHANAFAFVDAYSLVGKHRLARPLVREVLAAYENPH